MMQWPEDRELSRLYREMPEAAPGARLKERVFAVAMEHAAAMRNRQAGKHEPSAPAAPARLFRGWWLPAGLAASVMLSVVSFLLFRPAPEPPPIVVAQQDIPAAVAEPQLPPRIRIAEVEPARRSSELPASDRNTEASESVSQHEEDDAATAQASGGFPGEVGPGGIGEGVAKGRAPDGAKPPEVWLEEIRALKKQDKLSSAKEKMRQFRQKYPDHPLPDDLKLLAVRGL